MADATLVATAAVADRLLAAVAATQVAAAPSAADAVVADAEELPLQLITQASSLLQVRRLFLVASKWSLQKHQAAVIQVKRLLLLHLQLMHKPTPNASTFMAGG